MTVMAWAVLFFITPSAELSTQRRLSTPAQTVLAPVPSRPDHQQCPALGLLLGQPGGGWRRWWTPLEPIPPICRIPRMCMLSVPSARPLPIAGLSPVRSSGRRAEIPRLPFFCSSRNCISILFVLECSVIDCLFFLIGLYFSPNS